MGRSVSVFLFFALSTIAIIVMQPGPREMALVETAGATQASRNELTALAPQPERVPLPVPDNVLLQIKQAAEMPVMPTPQTVTSQTNAAVQAALSSAPTLARPQTPQLEPTVQVQPAPQPSFVATPQPAPQAARQPMPAPAPVSPDLRDMSWSALGDLQKLGHIQKAPGSEGSLINSIVRRSMKHVDDPVIAAPAPALTAAPAQPAVRAPAAIARQSASLSPAPRPAVGAIGARGSYTVAPGDNLALIAVKLYGSALKTDQLLQDNPALRANPNSLRIGQILSYRMN